MASFTALQRLAGGGDLEVRLNMVRSDLRRLFEDRPTQRAEFEAHATPMGFCARRGDAYGCADLGPAAPLGMEFAQASVMLRTPLVVLSPGHQRS
jgi:hypothetical protein